MSQATRHDLALEALLGMSVLSVPFTLTHSVEDFEVGVHQDFGLTLLPAAFLLSLGLHRAAPQRDLVGAWASSGASPQSGDRPDLARGSRR